MQYELSYRQPYEYDEDSSSGIGDHSIGYTDRVVKFEALSDKVAKATVVKFMSEGGVMFDHHLDGDGKVHPRRFVGLTCTRGVRFAKSVLEVMRDG